MKPNAENGLRLTALAGAAVGAGLVVAGVAMLTSAAAAMIVAGGMLIYVARSLFA